MATHTVTLNKHEQWIAPFAQPCVNGKHVFILLRNAQEARDTLKLVSRFKALKVCAVSNVATFEATGGRIVLSTIPLRAIGGRWDFVHVKGWPRQTKRKDKEFFIAHMRHSRCKLTGTGI